MIEKIIDEQAAGQRLDKMLAKYLDQAPKSFLYKMLRKKNITLNGHKASGAEMLGVGDRVKFFLADETIAKFRSEVLAAPFEQLDTQALAIVFENSELLLLNKPVGLLSQKAIPQDVSINELLVAYLLQTGQIEAEQLHSFRPSICNRLDRNTSGLITAAKSLFAARVLNDLFQRRNIGKYYLCLVVGHVPGGAHIKGYLHKDHQSNKVTVMHQESGDNMNAEAIETEYQVLHHGPHLSLLKVHLITGKSHQIRAHLASIGHPILGDFKYGQRQINERYQKQYQLSSQLLHAYQLVFPDLSDIAVGHADLVALSDQAFMAQPPPLFTKICQQEGIPLHEYLE